MTDKTLAMQFIRYKPRPRVCGTYECGAIINILAEKERRLVEVSAFESGAFKAELYALEEDFAHNLRFAFV